jgi:hypothetical protein
MRKATCEKCGAVYKVPDSVTAKRVRCKKCSGVVSVPALELAEAALEEIEDTPGPSDEPNEGVGLDPGKGLQGTRPRKQRRRHPVGLGGWLILVFLHMILAIVSLVILITYGYLPLMADVAVSPNEYEPGLGPFLKFELLMLLGFLIVEIAALVFFYKKHRLFPKIYIGIRLAYIVWLLLNAGAYRLIAPDEPVFDSDTIGNLIQSRVAAVVWISYMLHSKRVANTFVN